jgi:hypothetical protein
MTSPCDVIFELLCFYIEHNDNIQGVPKKVNPFKFKSAITYCSNSLMRHKWQPRSQALPSCGGKKLSSRHENIEYWNYYWNLTYIWPIFVCAFAHFVAKAFWNSRLYISSTLLLQHMSNTKLKFISNFNTAHFRIQYCTLFIQYCTKCAILHTKIGPVTHCTKLREERNIWTLI